MKFIRRPLEVTAIQYTGPESVEEMRRTWGKPFEHVLHHRERLGQSLFELRTIEGVFKVEKGDWIVEGFGSQFYSVSNQVFLDLHEPYQPKPEPKEVANDRSEIAEN